ncbi:hypothetical protein BDN72DRAFT_320008 [Pluteus cervinus]|uniref:Uncharacterized protein n=1 Tax=Pluteus cervinus TaxID=181527 RepID=A0ACD3ACW8_9AGAR|nr:hypothetical protein BDN72DRAFT_320008 [Pluteus cervinus]
MLVFAGIRRTSGLTPDATLISDALSPSAFSGSARPSRNGSEQFILQAGDQVIFFSVGEWRSQYWNGLEHRSRPHSMIFYLMQTSCNVRGIQKYHFRPSMVASQAFGLLRLTASAVLSSDRYIFGSKVFHADHLISSACASLIYVRVQDAASLGKADFLSYRSRCSVLS